MGCGLKQEGDVTFHPLAPLFITTHVENVSTTLKPTPLHNTAPSG